MINIGLATASLIYFDKVFTMFFYQQGFRCFLWFLLAIPIFLISVKINAHDHAHHSHYATPIQLDTQVISSPSRGSIQDIAQPVRVVNKEAIQKNSGDTLGTLLERIPGISNASFGAGVGRPVIRGMSGSRVKILQNGSDTSDLSAMSSDHAPMAEASSAEQIEILYGPATLMYGGGAIGGVVNLVDKRIHEYPVDGLQGEVSTRFSSQDKAYNYNAALEAGKGNWVLHLDGFKRDANDYKAGQGRIANSDSQGQGGALALSWVGSQGFIGASINVLEYDYAVPNTDNSPFRVKPEQLRYDIKAAWRPDLDQGGNWLDEWRTELAFNDYAHSETEPGLDVGLFDQESWELRSYLRHLPLGSWQGSLGVQMKQQQLALCHNHSGCNGIPSFSNAWDGQSGYNLNNRLLNGYYFSHDTPMPTTETRQLGVFWIEERDWAMGRLELGARLDRVAIQSDYDPIQPTWRQNLDYYDNKSFNPATLTAAATWVISTTQRFGLSLGRVQRAPEATELFWNGDHHATFSFQLDNPDLEIETAYTLDLNWLYQGAMDKLRIGLFYYQFEDYIYNDLKSFKDPFHGNDVYRYEQDNAQFYGAEFSWHHQLNDAWHLDFDADFVRAELTSGVSLPRTPPISLLVALDWHKNGWTARLESQATLAQNKTAPEESSTDAQAQLNASAGFRQQLNKGEVYWYLAAQNLTNEQAINHVSYLKQAAPLAGRNLQAGMRWHF